VTCVLALSGVAAAQPARQVVQAGPTGPLAISKDGYVAVVDEASALHIYHLPSRTLVRSLSSAALNERGGLVHPVIATWDDATQEVLLPRADDILAVGVDGKLTSRAFSTTRLWAVRGGGKARWITRQYGDAEVHDASWKSLGKLANSESLVAAGDGRSALVATKDGKLERFTLDPVAKHSTIALPFPIEMRLTGRPIAVTADGTTAVACVKTPKEHQAVIVRNLDKQATITPINFAGGMIGCDVALAELHGIAVVATTGEIRGFDLATGALRWQAPRDYAVSSGTTSEVGVYGRTVVVSWRGLLAIDALRGDVIGQIGTDIARPRQLVFLRGDQLLTVRQNEYSMFGPTGVALATWSLKNGKRTNSGTAMWGFANHVADDGTLVTARSPTDRNAPCWVFSKGTTGDGAPMSKDVAKGAWPPAPGKSVTTCMSKPLPTAGVSLGTGAIVVNGDTNELVVIDAKGSSVKLANPPRYAMDLEFSPDGKWVMGSNNRGQLGTLQVWNAKTGAERGFTASAADKAPAIVIGGPNPRKGYTAHAVSPDSQQIALAGEDTVTLYALASKQVIRTATIPNATTTAVAVGPGGVLLAGTVDGRLVVAKGAKPIEATSPGGALRTIVVRADGKRAASVSDDGAVRIWDLAKPALLATLVEASDGESFASTPGGAYAGGREAANQLGWIFDGPTEGFAFERFAGQLARADIVAKRLADATTDLNVAIVRPPRVTITKQPPPSGSKVQLGLRVESASGKPGSLRVFVNGRQAVSATVDTTGKDIALDVPLEAGSNVVTVVAFDEAGRSSNPKSIDVGMPAATTRPDVWVIAAGVGWYPNLPVEDQLEGSVNDAYAIADVFTAQAGPGKRYDKAHVTVLEDEQVTGESLDKALAQLASMKPTDVAVVFLAGHGVRLPKTDDMVFLTGTAKLDKTTWASAGIGWARIGAALAKAKGRVIVLLDACHAGNVTQEQIVPNTQLADDLVGTQRAGVLVFAASKGSQKSLEENAARAVTLDDDQKVLVKHKRVPKKAPPPPTPTTPTAPRERRGNGYFTGAVVAALDSPVTDVNRDGAIQTAELITQVQLRVIRASRGKQTPWVARRELFGDFALATATK
jgi:hypothetical protein